MLMIARRLLISTSVRRFQAKYIHNAEKEDLGFLGPSSWCKFVSKLKFWTKTFGEISFNVEQIKITAGGLIGFILGNTWISSKDSWFSRFSSSPGGQVKEETIKNDVKVTFENCPIFIVGFSDTIKQLLKNQEIILKHNSADVFTIKANNNNDETLCSIVNGKTSDNEKKKKSNISDDITLSDDGTSCPIGDDKTFNNEKKIIIIDPTLVDTKLVDKK